MTSERLILRCSFCEKNQHQVKNSSLGHTLTFVKVALLTA